MMDNIDQQLHNLLGDLTVFHVVCNKSVLSRHGLRRVRYYTMHHLSLQPELTLSELCARTLVDPASSSRMVYKMEKEGLVRRQPSETDRRQFTLSLTDEGLTLYRKVQADLEADIQKRFEILDESTKSSILALNQQLRDALIHHSQWQTQT